MMSTSSSTHQPLFCNEDGSPMKFHLIPCPDKKKIREIIEREGGILISSYVDNAIRLTTNLNANDDKYIHTDFIYHTEQKKKKLDIEQYRVVNIKAKLQNYTCESKRSAYTPEEDEMIVDYIRKHCFHQGKGTIGGNCIWKQMEAEKVTSHSWQSMKAHYQKVLKNIYPAYLPLQYRSFQGSSILVANPGSSMPNLKTYASQARTSDTDDDDGSSEYYTASEEGDIEMKDEDKVEHGDLQPNATKSQNEEFVLMKSKVRTGEKTSNHLLATLSGKEPKIMHNHSERDTSKIENQHVYHSQATVVNDEVAITSKRGFAEEIIPQCESEKISQRVRNRHNRGQGNGDESTVNDTSCHCDIAISSPPQTELFGPQNTENRTAEMAIESQKTTRKGTEHVNNLKTHCMSLKEILNKAYLDLKVEEVLNIILRLSKNDLTDNEEPAVAQSSKKTGHESVVTRKRQADDYSLNSQETEERSISSSMKERTQNTELKQGYQSKVRKRGGDRILAGSSCSD